MPPSKPKAKTGVAFEEFWRRAVFGVICGSVTGFTVGGVDAYKLIQAGKIPKPDIPKVAFHEMGRSAVIVAGFFSVYNIVKTSINAAGCEYPEVNVGGATAVATLPLSVAPALRRYVPYRLTLVAVDAYHSYFAPKPR